MGFGNIGQGLSALLRKRFSETPIFVFDEQMNAQQIAIAEQYGFAWLRIRITRDNYVPLLETLADQDSLVINIATSINSCELIAWTQQRGAHYLDTCIDPWDYQDGELESADNTNYQMREKVLRLQAEQKASSTATATAIVAHGANPGLVSPLVKEALLMMARQYLAEFAIPDSATDWALLAETLGVRVIQVSERDSQYANTPRADDEFVNTWSVDGFVAEALQPVELGWGSHESSGIMAADAQHHAAGCRAAVYFKRLGAHAKIKTWTPGSGEIVGRLISHNEAFSIASYLTLKTGDTLRYRPTVYYAYHACDQAMASLDLLADGTRQAIKSVRVLKDEIIGGIDELGVLLISDRYPGLWFGSQLSIERTRQIAPYNNATSLQVVGSMLAAMEWIGQNPRAGIVESEELDHEFLIGHARPYWEPLVSEFRQWQPDPNVAKPRYTLDEFWLP